MPAFEIGPDSFMLDGRPHRIIAGAIHYFRVHPEQWRDRIRKAKAMGLNTIETYVAWNIHEPEPGRWVEDGPADLGHFLDLIAEEGLHAIVRPGPYICAEWRNGGLPDWLTREEHLRLRTSDLRYLEAVTRFLQQVYRTVVPRQIHRGGSVILVQIENEYGAYGSDVAYLEELVRVTRDAGIELPLTSVDQPEPDMLKAGSLPSLHKTGSFGSRSTERLATLREHQPTGPLMCMEFWCGWFDSWGSQHHRTDAAAAAAELDTLLAAGASVNIYMFHGGTNFGLGNGANDRGRYLPITTSYDYDAPLDEAGRPTEKFFAFRDVIARHTDLAIPAVPAASRPAPAVEFDLTDRGPWLPTTDRGTEQEAPANFDELGFDGAVVVYERDMQIADDKDDLILDLVDVRDNAWVYVDDVRVGTLERARNGRSLVIPRGESLRIVVEDAGRVNYDVRLGEPKGLTAVPRLDGRALDGGWRSLPVDVSRAESLARKGAADSNAMPSVNGPSSFVGTFELEHQSDLFLDTTMWRRGFAFINGFLLGRYDHVGPQRTLYVPSPVTRLGTNTVVILELDHLLSTRGRLVAVPDLGHANE